MLLVAAFNALLLVTCGYAIWQGGKPEQWTAAALLTAAAATLLVHLPRSAHFRSLETEVLLVDLALLALLVAVALKANRYWPLWLSAIHAGTVAVHLAKLANPSLVWPVYAYAASASSIPMQLMLFWAAVRHRRRLARFGSDPPWTDFSRPLTE
ncbi:MAG TPA: hypothetical protein VF704_00865 [Allosphingosinicella sp.]|jgi:hypothetical protein